MAEREIQFNASLDDFRHLQAFMGKQLVMKNRGAYGLAFFGVVLAAFFILCAILVNIHPILALRLFGAGYPMSLYLGIIVFLFAAILALTPAVRLRIRTMRLQMADDSPLLGPTRVAVENDGLVVERKLMRAKYLWPAIRGVEIAKTAVILPIDNGVGIIIPASAFPTEARKHEFVAEIHRHRETAQSR